MQLTAIRDVEAELDWQAAGRVIDEVTQGADDGELYFAAGTSENFSWDDGKLKGAGYDAGRGFGIRVVHGEKQGFAHSATLTPEALRRAGEAAALAKRGHAGTLAEGPARTNQLIYTDINPLEQMEFTEKAEFLGKIDAYLRARDPRVVRVTGGLSGEHARVVILRAHGERYDDVRPMCQLNISVTVERDGVRESGSATVGGRYGYDRVTPDELWKSLADEALRVALLNLDAIPAPSGEMDVVLAPGWTGVMIHEAVGHGLEGDFNRLGQSTYSGKVGERVAAPGVTIVDNGAVPDSRGSLTVDDEGTPTRRTVLVEDGILKGYM